MLLRTQPHISHAEAKRLSHTAIDYSRGLAKTYNVTTPPLVHNFLVNVGAKDRGLCYQWGDDLQRHLQNQHYRTVQFKPVGAFIGSYWREHNAVVALPKGAKDLRRGVLLDAWRNSGELYFVPINNDPEYHWQIRYDRGPV